MCDCVDFTRVDYCCRNFHINLIMWVPIMKTISDKMSLVQNIMFHGRANKNMPSCMGQSSFATFLLAVCLLSLNAVVSANRFDWKSTVPNRTYSHSSIAPVYNPGTSSARHTQQPYLQKPNYYNNHNYFHPRQNNHHQQQFKKHQYVNSEPASPSFSPSSRFNAHDPRMNFFFADSTSSTASSSLPVASSTLQTLVPRPRSLSNLPSENTTSISTNSSITSTTTSTPAKIISSINRLKKRKRQRKAGKAINLDAKTSSTNNAITSSPAVIPASTELQEETSRTFFLTPLLAYLFPVFIAQMFGMGMIPAAALITLPIFLLPLGITAAIFLI